jgi:hypothetical protein
MTIHVAEIQIADDRDVRDVVVDQPTLGVLALGMRGIAQSFGHDVVAEGDEVRGSIAPIVRGRSQEPISRRAEILVGAPRRRTVIDDDVVSAVGRDGVDFPAAGLGLARFARSNADVLNDDVVSRDRQTALDQGDARRRRRLPGDRDVGVSYGERHAIEIDHAGHFEYDDARSLGRDG